MPSLKTIKLRIKSVKSTQKITKAMKMVAASKLKRAREQVESSALYAEKINITVQSLASSLCNTGIDELSLLYGRQEIKTQLLLVITSDRGLCGSFNQAVGKLVKTQILESTALGINVKILCVGKKGYDLLKIEHKKKIVKYFENLTNKYGLKFIKAKEVANYIIEEYENHSFDECLIFYNKFKSVISQIPTKNQLIPLKLESECLAHLGCEYEPDEEEIIEHLLPKNLAMICYSAMLQSNASEQAARMTAMENATRNSGEMIKKLNLVYNRTRQAYITKELIEIISGSESI